MLNKISICLLFSIINFIYAEELQNCNIAIIWNDNTYSTSAPYGWQVGGTTKEETTSAPEIGKAQLKRVLNALDHTITIDSTNSSLDTTGIPDELTDHSGINGRLRNIRIYKSSSRSLSLSQMVTDFNGEYLSSIVYINAGFVSNNPDLYQVLRDAAAKDIGVVLVGSEAANETQYIDTFGNFFPAMGVQDTFRVKAFTDDILKEFDFDIVNNTVERDNPDTVALKGNYSDKYYIIRMSNGILTTDTLYKKEGTNVVNNTIYPNDYILAKYGEWSIKAKAVSIIADDLYAPEMSTGVYNNHDLILVSDNSGKITVPDFANWGSNLWTNSQSIDIGDEVLGLLGNYNYSEKYFELSDDFIKEAPNAADPGINDSIFVLKKGTKISLANSPIDLKPNSLDNSSAENYMDTYLAGGYKTLRIDLKHIDSVVFSKVFPTLDSLSVSSLNFKPWSRGGRIRCDADIWAFNEKFNLGSFDTLYDMTGMFDTSVYYVKYLGNQVAISPEQFTLPALNENDFDKSAGEMRIDSLGFEGDFSYGRKLYHSIAVMQKKHRRVMLLGFQPSYLESDKNSRAILLDGMKWVSVPILDHNFPKPYITPVNNSEIPLNFDTVQVIMDFTVKGHEMHKAPYSIFFCAEHNGEKYSDTVVIPADDDLIYCDTFVVLLSKLGLNNEKFKNNDNLHFTATAEPKELSGYHGSFYSVEYLLKGDVSNDAQIVNSLNKNKIIKINNQKIYLDINKFKIEKELDLGIYSLSGRKIQTLFHGDSYQLPNAQIESSYLAKGAYLLILKGVKVKICKKVILS